MMRTPFAALFGRMTPMAVAALVGTTGHAAPAPRVSMEHAMVCKSVGAPNHGHLEGGAHIDAAPHLRFVAAYASMDVRWGTRELVGAVDRAAREVRKRYPDAVLGVGHLSRRGGGEIDRHHSHESGRDADLAFYLVNEQGRPAQPDHFVAIRPDGRAASDAQLRFDDARNWALLYALLNDPRARVTHVFVASHLRARLLAYGARIHASPPFRARLADVLMQPHHALPHDDHFHVRVACPPGGGGGCLEYPLVASVRRGPQLAKGRPARPPRPPVRKLVRARSTGRVQIEVPVADALDAAGPIERVETGNADVDVESPSSGVPDPYGAPGAD